jgi:all-trans-retinol 13,14-reductase
LKYDIIIIGSGLGGLECGYILAKQGRRVCVLEREAQAGGCMQSYRRKGVALDTGLHYVGGLTPGNALYPIFKYLNLMDLPWQHLDPSGFDRITIGGRDFSYAEGLENFVETLAEDFPHERAALQRYASMMGEVGRHLYDALLPRDEVDFFNTSLFGRSAYDFLNETFSDDLLRNVLSGSSLKMELNMETLPLYTFAQGNNSFIESSWRLKGDGALLVDKLVDGIRHMGGEVICNAGVDELVEQDGRLVAALADNGERYEADWFISNAHPAVTADLVKQSSKMKKIYRTRMHALSNTYGMYTVSLILKPGTVRYFNWNQYIYRQPNVWTYFRDNEPVSGILISCRVPEDGSEYTRCIDLLTPMPWEKVSQWADTSVGRRGDDYRAFKERKADECIALAETFLPGLRDCVEAHFSSTPLTYRDYTLTPEGSAYGVRKDWRNPMMTLLTPKTPIPNLLLTGQSLTLHGLLGVSMTSLFTCAEILGKEAAYAITQTE